HADVLHDAGRSAAVRAAAVGQGVAPDDEIAGAPPDRLRAERVQVLPARIGVVWHAREPCADAAVESGYAGEGALLGRRVGQIKNALGVERHRLGEAGVPVQIGPGEMPTGTLRDVEADPVGRDPQISGPPQLRERLVYARRAAVRGERGVLEVLHHDAVVAPAIPRVGRLRPR